MENLVHGWHVAQLGWYVGLAVVFELMIRAVIASFNGLKLKDDTHTWRAVFRRSFLGMQLPTPASELRPDFWTAALIGLIELISYPILMACNAWAIIGAWLAFKTVPAWREPGEDRFYFNLYLVGNGLVIITAFFVLLRFVSIAPPTCPP
jgi:hypothetical protein